MVAIEIQAYHEETEISEDDHKKGYFYEDLRLTRAEWVWRV